MVTISRACLRISDHCRVTVRVRVRIRVRVADCCLHTVEENGKMRINHVMKLTNGVPPYRSAPLRI